MRIFESNEKFSGEGAQPPAPPSQAGRGNPLPTPYTLDLAPKNSKRNENWYPPLFGTKLRGLRPCVVYTGHSFTVSHAVTINLCKVQLISNCIFYTYLVKIANF